jgi:phage shock protein B
MEIDALMVPIVLEFLNILKLATIFAFVLGIIWLNRYYKTRRAQASVLADEEKATLDDLARLAQRLEERVATLEKILDADDPKWRDRAA